MVCTNTYHTSQAHPRYVIYTVLIGGYDSIEQPLVTDSRFDYVLFSNDLPAGQIGVWQVRPFPIPETLHPQDYKHISRYPKTHPNSLLGDYDATLYMDANLQIADHWVYERCVQLQEQQVEFAGIKMVYVANHSLHARDDIYEHAYDMACMGVVHDYDALRCLHTLYKAGFPRHHGLTENGVLFRRNTHRMQVINETWWQHIVQFSFRDQFSLMYVFWQHNFTPATYFLPQGEDVRNSPHIRIKPHAESLGLRQKWQQPGRWEKRRIAARNLSPEQHEAYLHDWLKILQRPLPVFWNFLWGLRRG